jgi:hypothetical protein
MRGFVGEQRVIQGGLDLRRGRHPVKGAHGGHVPKRYGAPLTPVAHHDAAHYLMVTVALPEARSGAYTKRRAVQHR